MYREGTAAARRPGESRGGGGGEGEGGRATPAVGHEHQRGSPERKGVTEGESRGTAAVRQRGAGGPRFHV